MIYRSFKPEKYTMVDNTWVKDPTLSTKAKGLLIYILSLPKDWDLHVTELVTHFPDGLAAIKSGLVELKAKGYIECVPRREEGKIIVWDYNIFENPQVEKLLVENPLVENQPLLNTNTILSTDSTKYIVASEEQEKIVQHLNDVLGKKPGKGFRSNNQQMLKLLNARLKDYEYEDIINVIDVKAKQWIGTDYAMYLRPTTLFNVNKFEAYVNQIDCKGTQRNEVTPLQILE